MGLGSGAFTNLVNAIQPGGWDTAARNSAASLREKGITPVGETPTRTLGVYTPPTQTSQYANPIPQYQPSRFDFNPYAAAYQQQFNANQPMQMPQAAPQQVSGLGALAQLYGLYNAAPQNTAAQSSHAASIAAAANTTI
jgi:hypothetical protein